MGQHKDLKPVYRSIIDAIKRGNTTLEKLSDVLGTPKSKLQPKLYQLRVWDLIYYNRDADQYSIVDNYRTWIRKKSLEELIDRAWEIWEAANG